MLACSWTVLYKNYIATVDLHRFKNSLFGILHFERILLCTRACVVPQDLDPVLHLMDPSGGLATAVCVACKLASSSGAGPPSQASSPAGRTCFTNTSMPSVQDLPEREWARQVRDIKLPSQRRIQCLIMVGKIT